VDVALQRGVGTLLVVVNVRDAQVFVDGQLVGQSPVATVKLKAGHYQVEVRRSGYSTYRSTASVAVGQSSQLDANLTSLEDPRRSLRPYAWTSLVLGVAMLGVGGGLTALAASRQSDLEKARGEFAGANENLQDSGKAFARGAIASFVIGGAGVVAGTTLFLVDRARRRGTDERAPTESQADATPPARRWRALPVVGAGFYGATAAVEF
jgi:hypothetical protein